MCYFKLLILKFNNRCADESNKPNNDEMFVMHTILLGQGAKKHIIILLWLLCVVVVLIKMGFIKVALVIRRYYSRAIMGSRKFFRTKGSRICLFVCIYSPFVFLSLTRLPALYVKNLLNVADCVMFFYTYFSV
jgi:hypothetical protein